MLHGRRAECALLDDLIEGVVESRSGVLVIRGEPGVGKSTLLRYAAQRAGGVRVLRGGGTESEVELPYAVLHQLLYPVLPRLDRLPEPQEDALRGAFGLGPGRGVDRFLVAVAVLTLLAEIAADGGLLVLVDDAQWADRPSADALVFVARRLQAEGVGLVFAAREGAVRPFEAPGLPELVLPGLDPPAATALLAEHSPTLAAPVAAALVARTGGNPLALMELPAVLSAAQLAGREPLPEPLPLGQGVEQVFVEAAAQLPESTRRLLLLVAAEETGDLGLVLAAAARLGSDVEALRAGEQADLVAVAGGRVEFRHPLVRSAVYQHASFTERRTAHLALAAVLGAPHQADRRAWHRAAVAVGTDPEVAAELEAGASRARQRAGPAAAAAALQRSAVLTPEGAERGRRLLGAADAAWASGDPDRALALLDRAASLLEDPSSRAAADHLRGSIELRCGTPDVAYELFLRSAAAAPDTHDVLESLVLAGEAASFSGDVTRTVAVGRCAGALTGIEKSEDRATVAMLTGIADAMSQGWERAADRLRCVVDAGGTVSDPVALLRAGRAALYLGDEAAARALHTRAAQHARQIGAVSELTIALDRLAFSDALAGRLTDAAVESEEGLRLAEEIGGQEARTHHLVVLALVAAWRGDEDVCVRHAGEAHRVAAERRLGLVAATASWALGLLELGLGRPDRAVDQLSPVVSADVPHHPAVQLWATPDFVEAAVRAGRPALADAPLERYGGWAERGAAPWAAAVAVRCRALRAEPGAGTELMKEALRRHAGASRPLELARTHLVHGELLRRERQRGEARAHLRAALQGFERLGAWPWADRARAELRAAGEPTGRPHQERTLDRLTAQELQIARLAAVGASNPEIAGQLFLSRRTVEYHLRKVFTKLGVASRTELGPLALDQ